MKCWFRQSSPAEGYAHAGDNTWKKRAGRLWAAVLLLILLACPALASEEIAIRWQGTLAGFRENRIMIDSPAAGSLTLTVEDGLNTWRTLTAEVLPGTNTILWDGLAEHGQRLNEIHYSFRAVVREENGALHRGEAGFVLGRAEQALEFAVGSAEEFYPDSGESWYAEFSLVYAGNVLVEICRAEAPDTPLAVVTAEVSSHLNRWSWDGRIAREKAEAGEYLIRFSTAENPAYHKELPVTLMKGNRPEQPVFVTGRIMPEPGDSDETIWELMTAPAVVVTGIKNTSHQRVYAGPNEKSAVLGTLHGQSQSLQVLELEGDWARITAWEHEDGGVVTGWVPLERLKVVQPRTDYGILIDKKTQQLTVFCHGVRVGSYGVSTGKVAKNRLYQETAAGSFLAQEHMVMFSTNGNRYDHVIRFDGGNLIHQCAWRENGELMDFSAQRASLGRKASHGCIRMEPLCTPEGINAWWVYTHIGFNTRIIVLDDPEERLYEASCLSSGADPFADKLQAGEQPELEDDETEIVLTFGGDTVLGTREKWWDDADSFPTVVAEKGYAYPFGQLAGIFGEDDLTLVNLECTLQNGPEGEDKEKEFRFRGLQAYTGILKEAGIEQVGIANNHTIDYGEDGMVQTIQALKRAGIGFSGNARLYVYEKDGVRIGFAGCRETAWKEDPGVIAREVEELRYMGADVVVYSCHWGREYSPVHNETQQQMAEAAAEAGADLVIGTHPHVVQGISTVDGTVVLYSLGNLMFGGTRDMKTFDGTLARVRLRFDADGTYEGMTVSLIPVLTSSSAPLNDYCPRLAEGEDRLRILSAIRADSTVELADEMYFPAGE